MKGGDQLDSNREVLFGFHKFFGCIYLTVDYGNACSDRNSKEWNKYGPYVYAKECVNK